MVPKGYQFWPPFEAADNCLKPYISLDIQTPEVRYLDHNKHTLNTKPQEVWLDVKGLDVTFEGRPYFFQVQLTYPVKTGRLWDPK